MRHTIELDGVAHEVSLSRVGEEWRVSSDGRASAAGLERGPGGQCRLTLDGNAQDLAAIVDGDTVYIQLDGRAYRLRYRDPVALHEAAAQAGSHDVVRAPMPGVVLAVAAAPGQHVRAVDTLLTIESMKVQMAIKPGRDGTVGTVHVAAGQTFERDAPLVTLIRDET